MSQLNTGLKIAVVLPCFRVRAQILDVIAQVDKSIERIYVVDDQCPEQSGQYVGQNCQDPRVVVLYNRRNLGVGGATLRGFQAAYNDGIDIVVKVDGDGQMDPSLVSSLVRPIQLGKADYVKGNRFYAAEYVRSMPFIRLLGNTALSFIAKFTTGYWTIMDPTNGFVALHTNLIPFLGIEKLDQRYFFENDMLYRLSLIRAVVVDMPMMARYGKESSHLSVTHSLWSFPWKFVSRWAKRFVYRYLIRDFNIASICYLAGTFLFLGGASYGSYEWIRSINTGIVSTSGNVMIAGLPIILGFQMLLFGLLYDVLTVPKDPIHPNLDDFLQQQKKGKAKSPSLNENPRDDLIV